MRYAKYGLFPLSAITMRYNIQPVHSDRIFFYRGLNTWFKDPS